MNARTQDVVLLLLAGLGLLAPALSRAQVTVVNMVPSSLSNETYQDSEPNVSVNPENPQHIAGSAFTQNPAGATSTAPIYVSTNGGATWTLNNIVPSGDGNTADITLRFGSGDFLYAGTLRGGSFLTMNVLRTPDFTAAAKMSLLRTRYKVDQPYVQTGTTDGGQDRVFVGNNDFKAPGGRSASVDRTLSGKVIHPAWTGLHLEPRPTCGQDGPPIRTAIHPDGTIYALYYRYRPPSPCIPPLDADVVVVRDDDWTAGAPRFAALTDPGDGLAGRIVVSGIRVPFINASQPDFGQERLVSANISLAVDPTNSSRVYIAWADYPGGEPPYTLHVRRSDDRGVTWTASDLITVSNATNPALAVNGNGKVAFLYQRNTPQGAPLADQRWETHLRRSADLGVNWDGLILANTSAATPAAAFIPYIGDYVHIQAQGKDWYGIFSASNFPDLANFPQGVTYQRNVSFATRQLLSNDGVTPVAVSIDPYFFKIVEP